MHHKKDLKYTRDITSQCREHNDQINKGVVYMSTES